MHNLEELEQFILERAKQFTNATYFGVTRIGGAYVESPSISPTIVSTGAVEVDLSTVADTDYIVPLSELRRLFTDPTLEDLRKKLIAAPALTAILRLIHIAEDENTQ